MGEAGERKRSALAFGVEKTHVFCYDGWEVMKRGFLSCG
jgi:hypothetical protein